MASTFEEQWHGDGERVLRQGISGSAFHVILEGDARVVIDGQGGRASVGATSSGSSRSSWVSLPLPMSSPCGPSAASSCLARRSRTS